MRTNLWSMTRWCALGLALVPCGCVDHFLDVSTALPSGADADIDEKPLSTRDAGGRAPDAEPPRSCEACPPPAQGFPCCTQFLTCGFRLVDNSDAVCFSSASVLIFPAMDEGGLGDEAGMTEGGEHPRVPDSGPSCQVTSSPGKPFDAGYPFSGFVPQGTSGNYCCAPAGDACQQCLCAHCDQYVNGCSRDPACSVYSQCGVAHPTQCTDVQTCFSPAVCGYQPGQSSWQLAYGQFDCQVKSCAKECNTAH